MINVRAEKVQDVFFWIAVVVLACLGFVYSSHRMSTFPVETVPVTFPRETVFFTLSAVAICFALLRGGALKGNKQIAFYLLAAFALWSVLATLWAVHVPGHARELVELVFFVGWAVALSALAVPLKKARMLTMVLGFSGGVVGLAVALGGPALKVFQVSLATWPFGNPNAAGMFCAFATVINSGLLLEALRKHKPHDQQVILPAACIAMALAGLCLTFSKGALLGLIIGEAVIAWRFFPKMRKWFAICAIVVVLLGAAGYVVYKSRTEKSLADTTSGFRVMAYKAAMKQIGDAPVGGTGLGSFYAYFPQHSQPDISGHPKMGDTVFHAHSNVLEIGTELGVVGMALFIAFTIYLGILPLLKKEPANSPRARLEGIWLAAFLTISAHALVAVLFYWTETVLYYWTAVGMLLALGRDEKPVEKVKRGLPFLAVAVVALAGLWYVGVYHELRGRMYVAMREKQLKRVRLLDKKYSSMLSRRLKKTEMFELQKLQTQRFWLYSKIIAELNRELEFVHVQRMRSDTYYQLGSAYYNVGGVFLDQSAPIQAFQQLSQLSTTPDRAKRIKKRYGDALHFFKSVVKDAPGYVNTDYFIGRACEGVVREEGREVHSPGQLEEYRSEAIKALERFLHYNVRAKMSGEATMFLVRVYEGAGKIPEAVMAINRHLELNPESKMKAQLSNKRKSLEARLRRKTSPPPKRRSPRPAKPQKQPPTHK